MAAPPKDRITETPLLSGRVTSVNYQAATNQQNREVDIPIDQCKNTRNTVIKSVAVKALPPQNQRCAYINEVWEKQERRLIRKKTGSCCTCECEEVFALCHMEQFCDAADMTGNFDNIKIVNKKSINDARILGNRVILKGVFRNLFHSAVVRHVYVYLELILSLVFVGTSVYPVVLDLMHGDADSTQSLLQWISLGIGVLGLLFSCLDTALLIYYFCKKKKLKNLTGQGGINSFSNNSASTNGYSAYMDITRIIVLEMIYYINLSVQIFIFVTSQAVPTIITFAWGLTGFFIFGPITKIYIFYRVIGSIRNLRNEKKSGCNGSLFIIYFFVNMIGLMILQIIMIVIIGITLQYEHTHETIYELVWYMLIFTYLMPHLGIFMFFFVHYFWTIKLPVDIIHDMIAEFQTHGKGANGSKDNRVAVNKNVLHHFEKSQFKDEYRELTEVSFCSRLVFPHCSVLHIFLAIFYMASLLGFFVCFLIIIDFNVQNPLLWIYVAVALITNIYAASVTALWLMILTIVIVILAIVIAGIALVILCIVPVTISELRKRAIKAMCNC